MKSIKKQLQQANDALLAQYVQEGNNTAFDVLMERHSPHLRQYIHTLVKISETEKDVLQDAWMLALEQLRDGSYKEEGLFIKWLNTFAYRCAKRADRYEQHLEHNPEFSENIAEETEEVIYLDPAEMAHAMHLIPAREREVVYMSVKKQMPLEKIAQRMHLKTNNIKIIFHRARKHLHDEIMKEREKKNSFNV